MSYKFNYFFFVSIITSITFQVTILRIRFFKSIRQNIQSIHNIYIIIFIRESFEIMSIYLANRSFSSAFAIRRMYCSICHVDLSTDITNNLLQEHCNEFNLCLIAVLKEQIKKYARKREHIEQIVRKRAKKKEQAQKKIELIRQKAQKRADLEVSKVEILKIKQRLNELRERRAQKETFEVAKSTSTSRDIDIFDSTLICDIQKFQLYNQVTSFLQHFEQRRHQYRKSNILNLLFECLRDFAFAWFKTQSTFIFEFAFNTILINTFLISIKFETILSTSSIVLNISSSSQYHSCVECFAQFFSIIRFLEHIKQVSCSKVICKHCEQNFNFKNKFHEHIREQHIQKSNIKSNLRFLTSDFTYKIKKKSAIICSSVSLASFILFATSKFSHLFIATFDITSKQTEIATMLITRDFISKRIQIVAFNCSFTFSTSSSSTFVRKHQKSYFIIDDLNRMFVKKLKSFDLRYHQNRHAFSQDFDIRSSRQTRSCYQSRITVYFMLAVNQKISINQISKSSKSKTSKQYMFAKFIRIAFNKSFFEKSILLSYKMSDIFYINLMIKKKFQNFICLQEFLFVIFNFFRQSLIFFIVFAFVSILSVSTIVWIHIYAQVI